MSFSRTDITWLSFGSLEDFATIGRDAIAVVSGIFALFLDRRTGERRIERFDDPERGDGASLVAGHPVVPIFSLTERRVNPRISVFVYPTMRRVSKCADSRRAIGYLCCAFVGTEHLAALSTFPDFRLVLWHWRSGERAAAVDTVVDDVDRQRIACSPCWPHLIGQYAPRSRRLAVYRALVCAKVVRLHRLETTARLDKREPLSFGWSAEGELLVCDETGEVRWYDLETDETGRVRPSTDGGIFWERPPLLATHRAGALVVQVPPNAVEGKAGDSRATETHDETPRGLATRLDDRSSLVTPGRRRSSPRGRRSRSRRESRDPGNRLVVARSFSASSISSPRELELRVFVSNAAARGPVRRSRRLPSTGRSRRMQRESRFSQIVSETSRIEWVTIDFHQRRRASLIAPLFVSVLAANSHPSSPFLATASDAGNCLLVDLSVSSSPKIAACLHLQREPLDAIKFSREGRILGLGASNVGRLFLLLAGETKVAGLLRIDRRMDDFLVFERGVDDVAKVLILSTESGDRVAGKILVYTCKVAKEFRAKAERAVDLSQRLENLVYGGTGGHEMLGVPRLSKQLTRTEILDDFAETKLTEVLPSLHRTRNIVLHVSPESEYLLTCGYDGLVVLRNGREPRIVLAMFVAHHRSQAGVQRATIVGDTVVSLGRNGDLVATRPRFVDVVEADRKNREEIDPADPDARPLSETRKVGTRQLQKQEEAAKTTAETWMEAAERDSERREQEGAFPARLSVLRDLETLRDRTKTLLDSNERESARARLPVCAFDVDAESRRRKIAAAEAERETARRNLEDRIAWQDRAAAYLREKFSKDLTVPPCSVFSVSRRFEVTNYPLRETASVQAADARQWSRFSSETRELASRWEEEARKENDRTGPEEEGSVRDAKGKHRFGETIASLAQRLSTCSRRGYVDVLETNVLGEERERASKTHFDRLFEETRSAESRQAERTRDLKKRLRRCVAELRETFGVRVAAGRSSEEIVDDPVEDAIATKEDASTSLPYDLGTSAKDFRQQALERMMDGVLEASLADQAKRNVPKPACLMTKNPSRYTEEDVRAIEAYEEKVRALLSHRRRYRSTLEAEVARIQEELRASATTLDERLRGLAAEKIKTEQAILRERASRVRAILKHRRNLRRRREGSLLTEHELLPATREARALVEEAEVLEAATAELRNRYEALRKRDRLLEGKFRSELAELKRPMLEHLSRHYRKRPRAGRLTCATSVVFLTELAKCVIVGERSDVLPREYQDFLRALDRLDAIPDGGLPARIESGHWRTMCRLRRVKIETEIKVRSCALETAEAEHGVSFHRKLVLAGRDRASRCEERLRKLERSLVEANDDEEIWLTLKTEQLEIETRGRPSDCEGAVLVPREELLRVEEAITDAEERKRAAVRSNLRLVKKISYEEWRHALARATTERLRERLEDLRAVKVTRVLRECSHRCPMSYARSNQRQQNAPGFRDSRRRLNLVDRERRKLGRLDRETRIWRRRNATSREETERSAIERVRKVTAGLFAFRSKHDDLRKIRMSAIARKLILRRKIRLNAEDLFALGACLELFRLRTYPTLNFQL